MNALEICEQARRIDDAESRRRYLAEACGGDAALRCRLESMLGIGSVPESFLGSPVVVPATGRGEEGAGVIATRARAAATVARLRAFMATVASR